jgi:hypothetical protein
MTKAIRQLESLLDEDIFVNVGKVSTQIILAMMLCVIDARLARNVPSYMRRYFISIGRNNIDSQPKQNSPVGSQLKRCGSLNQTNLYMPMPLAPPGSPVWRQSRR